MKKIISLISAFAMVASMAISASAAVTPVEKGISVMYDAAASTREAANFKLYLKGFEDYQVNGFKFTLKLDKTIFDCNAESEKNNISTPNHSFSLATSGNLIVSYLNAEGINFSTAKDGVIAEYTIPYLSGKEGTRFEITKESFLRTTVTVMVDEVSTEMSFIDGAAVAVPAGYTIGYNNVAGQTATVAGTTISEDAGSEDATYFKVENAPLAGTAYWYADFAGTAKKLAANVPNTVGTADLGLVYTGADAPSSVKIVCE